MVVRLFHMASRLQINLHKSKVYGVGGRHTQVQSMATYTRCDVDMVPFTYLGAIGKNMQRVVAWKSLLDRFHKRLCNWKAKMLSIGGRLTLVKSVLRSLGIYYMSLFKVIVAVQKKLEGMRVLFF